MDYPKIKIDDTIDMSNVNINRKRQLIRTGNFVYPVIVNINDHSEMYEHALKYIRQVHIDQFMLRCKSNKINDKQFENIIHGNVSNNDHGQYRRDVARYIRRIRRTDDSSDTVKSFRLTSESYTAFLSLAPMENDNRYLATIFLTDQSVKTMSVYMINVGFMNDGAVLTHALHTAFFIGQRYKDADKLANEFKFISQDSLVETPLTRLIANMLSEYAAMIGNSDIDKYPYPKYTDFDLFVFNSILSDLNAEVSTHNIQMFKMAKNYVKDEFDKFDKMLPEQIMMNVPMTYPKIDFSDKEWKFIDKYCEKQNILTKEKCNLLPYFTDLRYGDTFILPIMGESGKEYQIMTTFLLDFENNLLRIYVKHQVEEDVAVVAMVDFKSVNEFTPEDGLVVIQKDLIYQSMKIKHRSIEELNEISPLMTADTRIVFSIVMNVLMAFIIIHDRPERSRMVKCTERKSERIVNKYRQSKTVEREHVWRILKPVKEAKEYVQIMTHNTRKEAEYTLESWERTGHWRTLKSGKSIWVGATTCNRHKPISDKKEITIKL